MGGVPRFVMMVAMTQDRVIAHEGAIPWYDSEELQFFAHTIRYHACVMGRRTREAVPSPDPTTKDYYILSSRADAIDDDRAMWYSDLDELLTALPPCGPIFVLGGADVYAQMLARGLIDVAYVSIIPGLYPGDTWMPVFEDDFVEVRREAYPTYEFVVYERAARHQPKKQQQ